MTKHTDQIEVTGRLELKLMRADGEVKTILVKNLVTTVGKGVIADRMKASPALGAMSHMAVGTNNTAPAVGDTTLGAEVSGSRTSLTSTGVTANAVTYIATLGAGVGTGALTEAGIFNAGSGGEMLARTTFSTINKGAGDSLQITWIVTVG